MEKRWRPTVGQAAADGAILVMMAVLLMQRGPVGQAVQQGLALWAGTVVPALFPFYVTVTLAVALGMGALLPPKWCAFLLGALGGYPMGAATVGQLCREGALTQAQAAALLGCCNNAGPAFILGVAGAVFSPRGCGGALWCIHLLTAAGLFLLLGRDGDGRRAGVEPPPAFPAAFVAAVCRGAGAMVNIGGFVVLFSVVTALLERLTPSPLVLGAVELTCGVARLPDTPTGFVTAAALLGWGGVSVHCQTAAVLEGTGVPMGRYLAAKGGQAVASAALAWALAPLLWG